jgi:outer membrane murein-binding lipoprotein Lpp
MKRLVFGTLLLALVACQPSKEQEAKVEGLQTKIEQLEAENNALLNQIRQDSALIADLEAYIEEAAQQEEEVINESGVTLRTGTHNLTLQWISWDDPGTVEITDMGDGTYKVVGEQRSKENADYLTIEGTLQPVSERELRFNGTISSFVSYLNNGVVCVREGEQTFKATGKRKYWRLQNMTNCEGNRVTDYIDIYF